MIDWLSRLSLLSISVGNWLIRLSFLETWMDHDLARFEIIDLPVLPNVRWRTSVSLNLASIHVLSDDHVSVVATCSNNRACCTNLWNRVGSDLNGGVRYTRSRYEMRHTADKYDLNNELKFIEFEYSIFIFWQLPIIYDFTGFWGFGGVHS